MLALLLAAALPAAQPPADQSLVEAVRASITEVRTRQAHEPPPLTDRERLLRMGELDRAPREIIMRYDMSRIAPAERQLEIQRASALIDAVDTENQSTLLKMVPGEGWFLQSKYGDKAAFAAFQIVQHADPSMQEHFLPILAPLVAQHEIDGQSYGMMFDRVAVSHGQPQTYGTQFRCDAGRWRPYPIADRQQLDQRREQMGFPTSFADTKAYFDRSPPCPQTTSAPPSGMKLDN
jgi:hypothetical protein